MVWNIDKAVRLHKMSFAAPKGRSSSSALGQSIRGICLAYDESVVLIHTRSKMAYYDFGNFREERSQDVYKRFELNDAEGTLPKVGLAGGCGGAEHRVRAGREL